MPHNNEEQEKRIPGRFWVLAGSQFTSNLADGMSIVVFTLLASHQTTSAAKLGLVVSALSMPWFLFSTFAGTIIDVYGAHAVAVRANLLRFLLFMALALVSWQQQSPLIVLAAFALLIGVFEVLSDNAHSVLVPQLLPEQHLERANSVSTTAELAGNRFIGVNLAGLLIGLSPVVALGLNGVAYLLCTLLLVKLAPYRKQPAGAPASGQVLRTLRDNILFGFNYLRTHKELASIAGLGFLWNFTYGAQQSFLVLFVTQSLRLDEQFYSIAFSAMGIGAFIGGFAVNWAIAKLGRMRTLLMAIALCALQYPVKYNVPNYYVLLAAAFLEGLTVIMFSTIAVSFRHRTVEEQHMGRVTASSRLISLGALPLGTLCGGLIAETFGFMVAGALLGTLLFFPSLLLLAGIKNLGLPQEVAPPTQEARS
jgi:predicted MFS family arabinose efflux permease